MVKRTKIVIEDDVDGGPATTTIRFAVDGTSYEIDLNDANATKMREAFAPWQAHATKVGGASSRRPARRNNTAAIREWANANGFTVSSRGRVPVEVKEAYDRAH